MTDNKPKHSPIGASSMKRWKNCPGSVRLSHGVPRYTSAAAEEGTRAHDLAERILIAKRDKKPLPDMMEYEDEMIEAVGIYVDHMIGLQRPGCVQLYEHKFHLKQIHPDLYGTADGVTYYPDTQLLVISDYKHGAGVFVEAERNEQLMYYATGAVLSLGFAVKRVRIEIIQPRIKTAEAIRPWECDLFDILEFSDTLLEYAKRTEDPNAPLAAGEWCRFCPAAPICPLIKEQARALAQKVFAPVKQPVDFNELADTLEWLPVLESWIKSTREFAYNEAMKRDGAIPRHKIVPKRARRVFVDENKALADISKRTGIPQSELYVVKRAAMSPAQIEAIPVEKYKGKLKKKELMEFVDDRVEWKSSGFVLVHENDDRPAAKQPSAKSVFSSNRKVEIEELN